MREVFHTLIDGFSTPRNLKELEWKVRDDVFGSWRRREIDEAIVQYYEIYDCHSSFYKDDCIYQAKNCFIKPGDVVLDLGANIGIFTNFAADKEASKIYSFEPIQQNFQMLMMNRPGQCEAHRLAISDRDNKSIKISYEEEVNGGSTCEFVDDYDKQYNKSSVSQTIMTMTLDTLIDNKIIESPDFIKMDIEGAEYQAFRGISDKNLEKTRCIAMEMHEGKIGKPKSQEIYNRLKRLGFQDFTLWNPQGSNMVWFWKD